MFGSRLKFYMVSFNTDMKKCQKKRPSSNGQECRPRVTGSTSDLALDCFGRKLFDGILMGESRNTGVNVGLECTLESPSPIL